ncbi:MAG: DNA adenine methylase [Clostridiaceae bacterium]|jgi:DNA adenine methylase|nr:DNA adenine methylase [Clostridiaceae bacterium]
MRKNGHAAPVVKWAGGKRQILDEIIKHVPDDFTAYYEPFVGGGAVWFRLCPQKAAVNDVNAELVNIYRVIRDHVDQLVSDLKKHENNKEYFYKIRQIDRDSKAYSKLTPVEKASRTIYLNKTCYNGLFRVNQAGEFNTPFGNYKNPNIVNEPVLRAVSEYLNNADIEFTCVDFELALKNIKKGSFAYLDPPYDPVSITANFTGYDKGGFGKSEQIRLKSVCDQLNEKGIRFLLSNSATPFILELYKDYIIEIVQAKRIINSNSKKRGEIDEVLIKNYS